MKWIQVHSAGINVLLDKPIWQSDIILTSLNGIHPTPMAEHALTMMLAFRWRLRAMWQFQQRKEWGKDRWAIFAGHELRDSVVGIVGYGAIGRELARLAQAFGMRILAVNRSGQRRAYQGFSEPGIGDPGAVIPDQMFATSDLLKVLPECDYVVALTPLTAETHHLFDAEAFEQMKQSAFFFNLGRGGLVDETALIAALRQKKIDGAGLDVFKEEPLPPTSPFWEIENVLVSPHISGYTPKYDERAIALFSANIGRYLAGERMINVVDRKRGY